MKQTLIAALAAAALFSSGLGLAPSSALANPGAKGHHSWWVYGSIRTVSMRTERQGASFAWAEIQALRAFVRMP
jgi:hypothetical protein